MAVTDDRSIPRVAVSPMKTPSKIKAVTPATGTTNAHGTNSVDAAITASSSVSRSRKLSQPTAYARVKREVIINPHTKRWFTVLRRAVIFPAP